MWSIRSVTAIAISLAALIFAVGDGVGYASTTIPSDTTKVTMHALPLGKHWQGTLRYGVSNGVVYLDGTASKSTGPYSCMTTLPRAARAASTQLDITVNLGADGVGTIQVLNTGAVCPFLPPPGGAEFSFVSLAGISFPTTS
ncbi:MAG TPA: hypothetical protein VFI65_04960 [Streptosporangiaceae bacterium]|nr:hypothetical protein [Streptosporangiaceae bacterium]